MQTPVVARFPEHHLWRQCYQPRRHVEEKITARTADVFFRFLSRFDGMQCLQKNRCPPLQPNVPPLHCLHSPSHYTCTHPNLVNISTTPRYTAPHLTSPHHTSTPEPPRHHCDPRSVCVCVFSGSVTHALIRSITVQEYADTIDTDN